MMRRRNFLLIMIVVLGVTVTLGLQGCLFGGTDESADENEVEGADMGEPGMEMEGEMPAEPGMGGPPADSAAAPGGTDAGQLVAAGMAAKHDGDYVTARQQFEAAVATDAESAEAHWGLAWIYAEMADAGDQAMQQRAIDEFETFLKLGGTQEQTAEATAALERLQ